MKLANYLGLNRISYASFAKTLKCSAPQICRWVNETRTPSLGTVAKIHRATGGQVTAADFLPEDLPAPTHEPAYRLIGALPHAA